MTFSHPIYLRGISSRTSVRVSHGSQWSPQWSPQSVQSRSLAHGGDDLDEIWVVSDIDPSASK